MTSSPTPWRASFGPFTLTPSQRLLVRNGMPVRLAGRALDLLIALVESAGETVSKQTLLARVWPDVVVEEGSLRFHMVAVRKALSGGGEGGRYVVSTPNKGYTFVAEVVFSPLDCSAGHASRAGSETLPAPMGTIVGRDDDVSAIVRSVKESRLVSIVGAGGMGKTTVALAAAHALGADFGGRVYFVDLSPVTSAEAAATTMADALGLGAASASPDSLASHLGEDPGLLILDCCEHVIDGAAELAELLMRRCPRICLLATSREPLRAGAELVFRLQPLAFPMEDQGETAESALAFPAVQLFVDRAATASGGYVLSDLDAPLASRLCRELDGIPLAIELAAGRVEAFGLAAIMSHFDADERLSWRGRRTAEPRHQTLGATLDWSYQLLWAAEQRLLRRLSVFVTSFSLEAAVHVCCFDLGKLQATQLLGDLVGKSLLNVDSGGSALRYGLFDATRAFAHRKLVESGEYPALMDRFAEFFHGLAAQFEGRLSVRSLGLELPNLRAAIAWQFRPEGDPAQAVRFASSLCPILLLLSQVRECARWAKAALHRLPEPLRGSRYEAWLLLYSARATSFISTRRASDEVARSFRRAIEVAQALGDNQTLLHVLNGYAVALHRGGRFTQALGITYQAEAVARETPSEDSCLLVDSLMGASLHLAGEIALATPHLQRSVAQVAKVPMMAESSHGFDHRIRSLCGLARSLWLIGRYAEGLALAHTAIEEARASNHGVTHCLALVWAGSVYGWLGDLPKMEQNVRELEVAATRHAFAPYQSVARAMRGHLAILAGHPAEGVERVRTATQELHACGYDMVTNTFLVVLAQGQCRMSRYGESLETCAKTEALIRTAGDHLAMPDLLMVRACCLDATSRHDEGEQSYRNAIAIAQAHGSTFSRLRGAVGLAQLLCRLGRSDEARALLREHAEPILDDTPAEIAIARSILA